MNTENCGRLPAMSTTEPGFTAVCTHALKREGVKGKRAAVTLRGGRLEIVGEDGGAIPIDLADVARLRILRNEGRYTDYFHADIVRTSRRDLLVLSPLAARDPNYSATMRALAMAIALSGGMARIERGTSPFVAWLGTVMVGLLFLAGLCAGLFAGSSASPASPIVSGGSASAPRRRSPFCSLACCGTPRRGWRRGRSRSSASSTGSCLSRRSQESGHLVQAPLPR